MNPKKDTRKQYMDIIGLTTEQRALWQAHYSDWHRCCRCSLGKSAMNHVLCRGYLPASLLFIGEAPGISEDAIGYPFVGPAGKMLDKLIDETSKLIDEALDGDRRFPTYAIANILACYPGFEKKPTKDQAELCRPRLESIIHLANPICIVVLGKIAEAYTPPLIHYGRSTGASVCSGEVLYLQHPAYICRQGGEDSLPYKRFCFLLAEFLMSKLLQEEQVL